MYMTPFAKRLSGNPNMVHGPGFVGTYFKYNGETLEDIEHRLHPQEKND